MPAGGVGLDEDADVELPSNNGGVGPQDGVTSIEPVLSTFTDCHGFLAKGSLSFLKNAILPRPSGMDFCFKDVWVGFIIYFVKAALVV